MYICVTHVDAATGIPCNVAPMAQGPAFPAVKGYTTVWANYTEWPTDYPLFYGTCDDDADTTIPGVVRVLTEEQYLDMQETETDTKSFQVRNQRNYLLSSQVDTINPIRWSMMDDEQKAEWTLYRQELLDVTSQPGFPWEVTWPTTPAYPA